MFIGVDTGYGYTKFSTAAGRKGSFPSVVTGAPRGNGDLATVLGAKTLKHRLSVQMEGADKPTEYLVGQSALATGADRTWDTSGAARDGYDLLVLAALALANAHDEVDLGLGLPLNVYLDRTERKALRARLRGLKARVKIDSKEARDVAVSSVRVFPQAIGAYFDAISSRDGEHLVGQAVAVLDVGFKTSDFIMLTPTPDGVSVPDESRSGSVNAGIGNVFDAVRTFVAEQTGTTTLPPESLIETAISNGGTIMVRGKEFDVSQPYQKALQAVASKIESDLRRVWGETVDYLAAVLVVGGGGQAVKPFLHLPGARLADDPVYANAKGFAALLVQQDYAAAKPL